VTPILADAFFKPLGLFYGILSTILVFSISLVIRPLGGLIFGRLGDIYGRRPVLYTAMIGAGASTFLMGFLPTYDQAGYGGRLAL